MDYVPALCTHRPSHLPIGWSGEIFGCVASGFTAAAMQKLSKPYYLEEGEVVTRCQDESFRQAHHVEAFGARKGAARDLVLNNEVD